MRLVGGDLALDFVNSRVGPPSGPPDDDVLTSYPAALDWFATIGAIRPDDVGALRRRARRDPAAADAAFARLLRVRDDLDAVFRSIAAGRSPDAAALTRLRDDEAEGLAHALPSLDGALTWSWAGDRSLERPLRPVIHAAIVRLGAGQLERITQCGGCSFLFHDATKNRSRRWCSMEDCGTHEKVRRYVAARRSRARGAILPG
jgi:predicted RNA-binding Zn ribbon-like protein